MNNKGRTTSHLKISPQLKNSWYNTVDWVRYDWKSHRVRFLVEITAWALSIGNAIMMAFTIPDPPFYIMYPLWITGCSLFAWAAWTRGSFSMLANYLLLASIDLFGFTRMILDK